LKLEKMTDKALAARFKLLADRLQPIAAERAAIDRVMKARKKSAETKTRMITLDEKEQRALYRELKDKFGD